MSTRQILGPLTLALGIAVFANPAMGQDNPGMHPPIKLLDDSGRNVMESGQPVSPGVTCGVCHDSEYITSHSDHTGAGLNGLLSVAEVASSRPLDGALPEDRRLNCFFCHTPDPANDKRLEQLERDVAWAPTATLANTGIVSERSGSWAWNGEAFAADGTVDLSLLSLGTPRIQNCVQCHGQTASGLDGPVSLGELGPGDRMLLHTGEIVSPQRISDSGINLVNRENLTRSWDVHAERLLECTDCHHASNNPSYGQGGHGPLPAGLKFDSRRMPLGVYLKRPDHTLAGGGATDGPYGAEGLTCETCHDPGPTHSWLPYAERHIDELTCEACHTPMVHSVAVQSVDWTSPTADDHARVTYRGGNSDGTVTATSLVHGYQPALLRRTFSDGSSKLAPYNLVTSWYWISGDQGRPVSMEDVRAAFEPSGSQATTLLAAFDADRNGIISEDEGRLDSATKTELIRAGLEATGHDDPRIVGEIQPYGIHHHTAGEGWATRDCQACHDSDSRLAQPMELTSWLPGGVMPTLVEGTEATLAGSATLADNGTLFYQPRSGDAGLYVLGYDSVRWANILGLLSVIAVFLGISGHGMLRWLANRRTEPEEHTPAEQIYMYTAYERFWHWLQAAAIFVLLLTGLEIHFPVLRVFGFRLAVEVHNIVGAVVVANAVFAALYHLASGEIRQYMPAPKGFFAQAIAQTRYYLWGIFHGEPHPFAKTPDHKLNPLQQITYLGILNVLLPLQIVTGVLIWGAQRWTAVDLAMGGLTILAPLHAFGAWMFAAFLLTHIYLTTTGHTPMANIRAMVVGWEETESTQEVEER